MTVAAIGLALLIVGAIIWIPALALDRRGRDTHILAGIGLLIFFAGATLVILSIAVASPAGAAERGIASYYGYESGSRRADGKHFYPNDPSVCAHKRLPFGTKVRVTDLRTNRSITCFVRDRGPYIRGRIIDLSHGAARKLGILHHGTAHVRVEVLR